MTRALAKLMIELLPDKEDYSTDEIISRLTVLEEAEEALNNTENGRSLTRDEVKALMVEWTRNHSN